MNLLLVTFDQLRADMIGHPLVETPSLDAVAREGVRFDRHYSQAAPCSPGRAALYTGTYQMNNRVVANGTPLDRRFDNIAHLARRAGFTPCLFGYTDQGIDPRDASGPTDGRLDTYSEVLPGFERTVWMPDSQAPWLTWLSELGYAPDANALVELARESTRPVEHSISAYLTDRFLEWLDHQEEPWFAHLSYLRPHPPYDAAGEFAEMYDPDDVGAGIAPGESPHSLVKAALELDASAAPVDESKRRAMRAQYFGMVSEVDLQFGRVIDSLRSTGAWADTMVVITADHGEMLGDHGLKEKLGFFEESYHVPCIIHDPSRPAGFGTIVQAFTENIDLLPTVSDALGVQAPLQCDGRSLTVFLDGEVPERWRTSAHYEWDWRSLFIGLDPPAWPDQRFLELQNLAVLRAESAAYVHFGDGTWLCFDLLTDPTWRTATTDPAVVLPLAQEMLTWRQEHLDRTWTDMLLTPERLGRWPVSEAI